MGVTMEWPAAENLNQAEIESRKNFERTFAAAFKLRALDWIARVTKEDPLGITVWFVNPDKKRFGPVSFSGMVGVADVESLTSFLPSH